ncbi:Hpt domain-containing protein [Rhodospirillum rubrum]|uniref:Hpt domain-containing protein n=1 Tax=Rhodospirillum rubrum TaxID=1085 RepID=UPI0028B0FB03|nr:Hpt domain-containing protein [Rhodospirillum rubrum]
MGARQETVADGDGVIEAVSARLADEYLRGAADDLVVMAAILHEMEADPDRHDVLLPEIFRLSHDIKGQGGSFGYDLMSRIGNNLCRYLEILEVPLSAGQLARLSLYLETMRAVLGNRLRGDGGTRGAHLLAELALTTPSAA